MDQHGWGFCEAKEKMPDILFQRLVNCYVSIAYYAGVALVGQTFPFTSEKINVDSWKIAFDVDEVQGIFEQFFCDALPVNYEQIIVDEIRKHPLFGVAPATIPLSTLAARDQWAAFSEKFQELEKEVQDWAIANRDKLPNNPSNFGNPLGGFGETDD